MKKLKETRKAKIGLYTMGLKAYWNQFAGLRERMLEYGNFIAKKIEAMGAEVYFYGLADCETEGRKCGEYFNEKGVTLVFAHAGTYVTSASVLPVHQICKAPAVILNLQPTAQINYQQTSTGEWLAHCGACPVPELSNAFCRAGIDYRCINGLLGMDYTPKISVADENTSQRPEAKRAWKEIREWIQEAEIKAALAYCRFGFLGNNYSGMLDLYSVLIDVPDEIMDYEIPKLVLQPIVENSILHGIFEKESKEGSIVIMAWTEGGDIVFTVSDTGIGIRPERLETILDGTEESEHGSNIGIYNTHMRLKYLYGEGYGLHFESRYGQGTEVQVRIPTVRRLT